MERERVQWFATRRGRLLPVALGTLLLSICPGNGATEPTTRASGGTKVAGGRLVLPSELEPYRKALQASVRPFVRITGRLGPTKPWESKFGGKPYLPRGQKVPVDTKGRPMRLLAQVNFSEVPDVGLFPRSGILEFFLSSPSEFSNSDDLYGADFHRPTVQRNFRILYFPSVVQDHSRLAQDIPAAGAGTDLFPLEREARLSFSVELAPVSLSDHRAAAVLPPGGWSFFDRFGARADEVGRAYDERFPGNGHKMGGYAFFTQEDPRTGKHAGYDVLLLQIDTDDALGIMWGDGGVANFFIREKDLRAASFTDVLYNWDCY
jgi:uncharacterized protein YwqG